MPAVGESDMGLFACRATPISSGCREYARAARGRRRDRRAQLPAVHPVARAHGATSSTFPVRRPMEAVGVNTPEELAAGRSSIFAHGTGLTRRDARRCRSSFPPTTRSASSARCSSRFEAVDLAPLGVDKEIIVVDDCSRIGRPRSSAGVPGVTLQRMPRNGGKGQAVRAGHCAGDRRLPDHPGRRPRVRPARLRADAAGAARRAAATSSTAAATWGADATPNQSLAAYLGGRSLSLAALVFTGAYLTDTVTALKLFRTADISCARSRNHRLRARSRDHRADARARRGASSKCRFSYAPRSREEGKKIGAARLVHRRADVLPLSERMKAR